MTPKKIESRQLQYSCMNKISTSDNVKCEFGETSYNYFSTEPKLKMSVYWRQQETCPYKEIVFELQLITFWSIISLKKPLLFLLIKLNFQWVGANICIFYKDIVYQSYTQQSIPYQQRCNS